MTAVALLALAVQLGVSDSVAIKSEPNPSVEFGGRPLLLMHVKGDTTKRAVQRGQSLGTVEEFPRSLTRRHDETIARARALYNARDFDGAAALLAPAYRDEPDNLFLLNEYARALFWTSAQRDSSYALYKRLIAQLDRQHGTNQHQVAVDVWFAEAYWKLASMHLDHSEWQQAAFEIARFLTTRSGPFEPALEQVYTYLAEAYVNLRRADLARWSAQQALRINPRNADAVRYLRQLGPAAQTWPSNHVFACRGRDSLPCIGAFSFSPRPDSGLRCVAPREDITTPLSPCLRLGWVYVGQARAEVEEVLGKPLQAVGSRKPEMESFAYLVFRDDELDRSSYYVVEFERVGGELVAHSVQLTGDSTPLPFDFSGLRLGDSTERVLRQLGQPGQRGQFNDEAQGIRGEWWDWTSAAISLEIVGGRIFSIRLWRRDDITPARIQRDFTRFR